MFRTFTPLSLSCLRVLDTPSFNLSKYNFYTKKSDFYYLKGSLFRFLPEKERIIIDDFGEHGTKIRRKLKTWSRLKKPYLDFWYPCKTVKVYLILGGIFAVYNMKTGTSWSRIFKFQTPCLSLTFVATDDRMTTFLFL